MSLAIIGGTGLYRLASGTTTTEQVRTCWGEVTVQHGRLAGQDVVFLPRHGSAHATPPHRINHRANIAALKSLGVTEILATAAVGTLSRHIPPGRLALLTDLLDQTSGRDQTFFDEQVIHLDFSTPFCPRLRGRLAAQAEALGLSLHPEAVYVCTNGPRFESPAEIRMYATLGADLVGMTSVPETVLAREAEICYATVAIATNWAAGLSRQALTHTEVEEMMTARIADVIALFAASASGPDALTCECRQALGEYRQRLDCPDLGIPL